MRFVFLAAIVELALQMFRLGHSQSQERLFLLRRVSRAKFMPRTARVCPALSCNSRAIHAAVLHS
jgi:hypothetical protein